MTNDPSAVRLLVRGQAAQAGQFLMTNGQSGLVA